MTPHIVSLKDFLTPDALTGLAMVAGVFLSMIALLAVMTVNGPRDR